MISEAIATLIGCGVGEFLRRRYQIPLPRLIVLVLLYMLLVTAACALVFLERAPERPDSRPLRTRPPIHQGAVTWL